MQQAQPVNNKSKTFNLGAFIIVNDRMCKILLCQCSEKTHRIYIRCKDIETSKEYSAYISNSLFHLENFTEGDCSTIVDNRILSHISSYDYSTIRTKNETDTCIPGSVDLYSADGKNVIIGMYLTDNENYYRICNYVQKKNEFKCQNIFTKQKNNFCLKPTKIVTNNILEFDGVVVNHDQPNYLCYYDNENNAVGVFLS